MADTIYVTKSFEQITDISGSTPLTQTKAQATGVIYALVQFTGKSGRYTTDGSTAPTTSVGHYIAQYGAIEVWGSKDLRDFRAIETGSTGVLDVTYFGTGG